MRLGQLARQLEIKPEKIVSFLEKEKQLTIKSHPNSKVEDELIEEITNHFTPSKEGAETPIISEKKERKEEPSKEKIAPVEHIETVKAVAPQELKIIGKIDLPNKKEIAVEVDGVVYDQATLDEKKKEDIKADREQKAIEKEAKRKEEEEKRKLAREKREIEAERQAMLATEKNNRLSKEEEKKKAVILKAQKEREANLEKKRKAKQANHYTESFTSTSNKKKKKKIVTKPASTIVEAVTSEVTETEETPTVVEVREKSAYKRFIKWLNT